MSVDDRVLGLVESLYDAALDETLWPNTLQRLADVTGSQGATFWTLENSATPRLPVFETFNFDDRFIRDYLESMVPLDPTVKYLVAHPNEPIVHDGLILSEREKDLSAYYDWQRQQCDINYRMVGQVRPDRDVQAGVALHRSRKAGRYEPEDLNRFAFLYAHLQRALIIALRLGSLGALNACTSAMLDRNPAGIVLLDAHRRIVYANATAEALRFGTDGLRLSARGLVLSRKPDQDRLQQLIAGALGASAKPGAAGDVMYSQRPSGKRPFCIAVTRMCSRYQALSSLRPMVCITIADPEARIELPSGHLAAAFGLTGAEAKLAMLLANGDELRSAANTLGITYGTARARLTQIFEKTQTRRQAELVRVLLAGLVAR